MFYTILITLTLFLQTHSKIIKQTPSTVIMADKVKQNGIPTFTCISDIVKEPKMCFRSLLLNNDTIYNDVVTKELLEIGGSYYCSETNCENGSITEFAIIEKEPTCYKKKKGKNLVEVCCYIRIWGATYVTYTMTQHQKETPFTPLYYNHSSVDDKKRICATFIKRNKTFIKAIIKFAELSKNTLPWENPFIFTWYSKNATKTTIIQYVVAFVCGAVAPLVVLVCIVKIKSRNSTVPPASSIRMTTYDPMVKQLSHPLSIFLLKSRKRLK